MLFLSFLANSIAHCTNRIVVFSQEIASTIICALAHTHTSELRTTLEAFFCFSLPTTVCCVCLNTSQVSLSLALRPRHDLICQIERNEIWCEATFAKHHCAMIWFGDCFDFSSALMFISSTQNLWIRRNSFRRPTNACAQISHGISRNWMRNVRRNCLRLEISANNSTSLFWSLQTHRFSVINFRWGKKASKC